MTPVYQVLLDKQGRPLPAQGLRLMQELLHDVRVAYPHEDTGRHGGYQMTEKVPGTLPYTVKSYHLVVTIGVTAFYQEQD